MASVILPARRWSASCDDVVAALRPEDELIAVADRASDPITTEAPERATVVVAGRPEGCAGKANALAAGMERATHDVVVWTDDDVPREDGWLRRLIDPLDDHDAATEVPVYVGGGLWPLLEPGFVAFGSLGVASGDHVWGGGVAFDRRAVDERRLLADLRRTVGDDSLLSTRLEDVWADTEHPRRIEVGGSPRDVYHRLARFAKGAYFFDRGPTIALLAVLHLFALGCLLFPIAGAAAATLGSAAAYRRLDLRRPSVLLAFPAALVFPPCLLVGLLAPAFSWGGRTYRWRDRFDVEVVDGTEAGERSDRTPEAGR